MHTLYNFKLMSDIDVLPNYMPNRTFQFQSNTILQNQTQFQIQSYNQIKITQQKLIT